MTAIDNDLDENGSLTKTKFRNLRNLSYKWDIDSDNINSYVFEPTGFDFRFPIYQKIGNWVAINTGATIGVEVLSFKNLPIGEHNTLNLDGRAGLEFRVLLGKAYTLNGSSTFNYKQRLGVEGRSGYKYGLESQLELNRTVGRIENKYNSKAGVFIKAKNFQKNIVSVGPQTVNLTDYDMDNGKHQVTGGVQFKW